MFVLKVLVLLSLLKYVLFYPRYDRGPHPRDTFRSGPRAVDRPVSERAMPSLDPRGGGGGGGGGSSGPGPGSSSVRRGSRERYGSDTGGRGTLISMSHFYNFYHGNGYNMFSTSFCYYS